MLSIDTLLTAFQLLVEGRIMSGAAQFVAGHWLSLAAGLVVVACLILAWRRIAFYVREGRKLKQEPGYLTPRVTGFARLVRWLVGRLLVYLRVGRLIVIGKENLRYHGRLLVLPNHQIEKDAVVVLAIMGRRYFRSMMAVTQIFGWRVPLAAWQGIISVHHDADPGAAVKAAMRALEAEEDSSLVVFPEGALHRDGVLRRENFFAGAVVIGKHVAKKSQLPFAVVPAGVYYDRNPAHATLIARLARLLGITAVGQWFGQTTYGVTVAIGEPIAINDLPKDREKAMDLIFELIQACYRKAELATLQRFGEAADGALAI